MCGPGARSWRRVGGYRHGSNRSRDTAPSAVMREQRSPRRFSHQHQLGLEAAHAVPRNRGIRKEIALGAAFQRHA